MPLELRFKVTEERTELLPMGVYRKMSRDPEAQLYFAAHFLLDETGAYVMTYDEESGRYQAGLEQAWEALDPLPIRDIRELVGELQGEAEEAAVPKA